MLCIEFSSVGVSTTCAIGANHSHSWTELQHSKQKHEERLGSGWQRPKGMHKVTRTRVIKKIIALKNIIHNDLFKAMHYS